MDILDFLTEDHGKIRDELEELKLHLYDSDILGRLKRFGAHFALHENIEEEILFKSVGPHLDSRGSQRIEYLKNDHLNIFSVEFARFLDALNSRSMMECRADFLRFFEFVMHHMQGEEQNVFSKIRKNVDPNFLNDLGLRAEQQFYSMNKSRDKIK